MADHGSRGPDDRPSRVFARLMGQSDEELDAVVDAIARRLREPGLSQEELACLMMERVLARGLLRDRQSQCRAPR